MKEEAVIYLHRSIRLCGTLWSPPSPPLAFYTHRRSTLTFSSSPTPPLWCPPRLPSATSAAIRNSRSSEDEFGIDGNEREGEGGLSRPELDQSTRLHRRDYRASILLSQVVLLRDRKETRTPQYIAWTIEGPRGRQTGELEK